MRHCRGSQCRGVCDVPAIEAIEANGARIPLIGLGTWDLRGKTCARMVEAGAGPGLSPHRHRRDVPQRGGGGRGAARLRRSARRGFHHHQGLVERSARPRLRALGPGKPRKAQARQRRSAADPLAELQHSAEGNHRRALQDEARGRRAPHRRVELQPGADRGSGEAFDRAAGQQPDRAASLSTTRRRRSPRAARPACRSPPTARSRAAG